MKLETRGGQILCPDCNAAMYGTVHVRFYGVALWAEDGRIRFNEQDRRRQKAQLFHVRCKCGRTFSPGEIQL